MVDEPKSAADAAPTGEPTSQQPSNPDTVLDKTVQGIEHWQGEATSAFAARDKAKADARAATAQNEAYAKQIQDLQASMPNVTPEDLQRLQQIKEQEAEEHRKKALKEGDAEAIAISARKPLEEKLSLLEQDRNAAKEQLSALLRDQGLKDAIASSELKPVDPDVVFAALRGRVTVKNVGGVYVPEFLGDDGQPAYDADSKITDHTRFVTDFLRKHPGICKTQAQPGSGAPQPGAGSTTPTTAGQLPKSIEEWNTYTPEQKAKAQETMPKGYMGKLAFTQEKGGGMFDQQ